MVIVILISKLLYFVGFLCWIYVEFVSIPFQNLNVCMIKFLFHTIKTIREYMRAIHNFSMTKVMDVFTKIFQLHWIYTFLYKNILQFSPFFKILVHVYYPTCFISKMSLDLLIFHIIHKLELCVSTSHFTTCI